MNLNISHNSTYDVRIDQIGDQIQEMIDLSQIPKEGYGKSSR
jgi:hypothetical protein